MSAAWERAWEQWLLDDDAIAIGMASADVFADHPPIVEEAVDVEAEEAEDDTPRADVHVNLTEDEISELAAALTHLNDHLCPWGLDVITDFVDFVIDVGVTYFVELEDDEDDRLDVQDDDDDWWMY